MDTAFCSLMLKASASYIQKKDGETQKSSKRPPPRAPATRGRFPATAHATSAIFSSPYKQTHHPSYSYHVIVLGDNSTTTVDLSSHCPTAKQLPPHSSSERVVPHLMIGRDL